MTFKGFVGGLTTALSNNERKGALGGNEFACNGAFDAKGVSISLFDDSGVRIFCAFSSSS